MKTIGIYPGQFQPPHKGHSVAYKQLRNIAGPDTFVVSTDYDPTLEAALHFGDKEQILVRHGIDASHIRKVRELKNPREVWENFDPETTVVVYALNPKEAQRRVSGSNYYKSIDSSDKKLPFKSAAYILPINEDLVYKGKIYTSKNIREALGSHRFTNKQKEKWFKHFFGWFDLGLFELLKNKYTNAHQSDVFTSSSSRPIKEELANEIRKIMSELAYDTSTGDSNDGMPTVDNMANNNADAARQAQQQKQDLIKQKQQSERDLKSLTTDKDWKEKSILSLRKDQIPNKRKEIDNINQQITNPSATTSTTTSTTSTGY